MISISLFILFFTLPLDHVEKDGCTAKSYESANSYAVFCIIVRGIWRPYMPNCTKHGLQMSRTRLKQNQCASSPHIQIPPFPASIALALYLEGCASRWTTSRARAHWTDSTKCLRIRIRRRDRLMLELEGSFVPSQHPIPRLSVLSMARLRSIGVLGFMSSAHPRHTMSTIAYSYCNYGTHCKELCVPSLHIIQATSR